jgi:hypothetical protein
MSDSHDLPIDYGNAAGIYADGFGPIEEYGPCSHHVFTMRRKVCDKTERTAVARLIVPTALRAAICRLLLTPRKIGQGTEADGTAPEGISLN